MDRTYDTAVVLGARLRPDGTPGPALVRRVAHAADLHRQGRVGRLLLSGGHAAAGCTEAEAMRRLAVAMGVPEAALLVEPHARNTFENALFSMALLDPGECVVLVSDAWHLPRARFAFRRLGGDPAVSAPPPAGGFRHWRGLLREAGAFAVTLCRIAYWRSTRRRA